MDNQSQNNYVYDEIGNLKHDQFECIDKIDWTLYGKIKSITRTATSTKDDLEFKYDASGNRIAKIVKPRGSTSAAWAITYYLRDAQGNTMATYADKPNSNDLFLQEQNLYGSSRLGMKNNNLNLTNPPIATPTIFSQTIGTKNYELSNHLGSVLATVSDRKLPVAETTTLDNQFKTGTDGWLGGTQDLASQQLYFSTTVLWAAAEKYFTTVPGNTYKVRFTLSGVNEVLAAEVYQESPFGPQLGLVYVGNGTSEFSFTATTIQSRLRIEKVINNGTTTAYYLDNVRITSNAYYTADVTSATDMYAGGMTMPGRSFNPNSYRFGYGGHEKVDEVSGSGNRSE